MSFRRLRAIARHYWQKLVTNMVGRVFISPVGKKLRVGLARLGPSAREPQVAVAIVAHVYYLEDAKELARQGIDGGGLLQLSRQLDDEHAMIFDVRTRSPQRQADQRGAGQQRRVARAGATGRGGFGAAARPAV